MRTVWSALKKSLDCKTNSPNDVQEPKHVSKIVEKPKAATIPKSLIHEDDDNTKFEFHKIRGGSSRSKSPILVHGGNNNIRQLIKEASEFGGSGRSNLKDIRRASARSGESSEVMIRSLTRSPNCSSEQDDHDSGGFNSSSGFRIPPNKKAPKLVRCERDSDDFRGFDFPRSCVSSEYPITGRRTPPYRKSPLPTSDQEDDEFDSGRLRVKARDSHDVQATCYSSICPQCRKQAGERENVCWKHAVSEIVEEAVIKCPSPCCVIEQICRSNWSESGSSYPGLERVLKVHNLQKTTNQYEEYQEMVKRKARELQQGHSQSEVTGNEVRRFYGAAVACPLGVNGSSTICSSEKCRVCRILECGFLSEKKIGEGKGVWMTSTCERALRTIEPCDADQWTKEALIVCRVIAGAPENLHEDTVAGNGDTTISEDLYSLDPRAVLPVFVVIPKQVEDKANS